MRVSSLLIFMVFALTACRFGPFHVVNGNGDVVSQDRQVGKFKSVDARGFMNVYLSQGDEIKVRLEGESNILPYIDTRVEGDRLIVGTLHEVSLNSTHDLNVYITAPELDKISLGGSGSIIGKTTLTSENAMTFDLGGSGDVRVDVNAPQVHTSMAGSGKLTISGQTKELKVDMAGSCAFSGDSLKSEEAKITIMGSGDANVFASVKLDVTVAGSGDVNYWGNPTVTSHMAGSGTLTKKD
jgi:hypothetical protein